MENKYYRKISPATKLQAVQAVWSNTRTVKEICHELAISKQTYYQWEKKIISGMKASVTAQKRGRHRRDWIPPEEMNQALQKIKKENQHLMKKNRLLEQKNELTASDLKIARIIIKDVLTEVVASKKNGGAVAPACRRGRESRLFRGGIRRKTN